MHPVPLCLNGILLYTIVSRRAGISLEPGNCGQLTLGGDSDSPTTHASIRRAALLMAAKSKKEKKRARRRGGSHTPDTGQVAGQAVAQEKTEPCSLSEQSICSELQKLLDSRTAADSVNDSLAADILSTMAQLHLCAGRLTEAESCCRKSLEIRQQKFGKDSLSVAHTAYELASISEKLGNFELSENYYRLSLDLTIRKRGPGHRSMPRIVERLRAVLEQQGKDAREADEYAAEAIKGALSDAMIAFDFPLYEKLGKKCLVAKQYKHAEWMFACLRDVTLALCPKSPQLPRMLQFLALSCAAQGKNSEAQRLQLQALQRFEQLYGIHHPDTARCLGRLADLQFANQQLKAAFESAMRSRSLLQGALGKNHPDTLAARERIKHIKFELATKANTARMGSVRQTLEKRMEQLQHERHLRRMTKALALEKETVDGILAPVNQHESDGGEECSKLDNNVSDFLWQKFINAGRQALTAKNFEECERVLTSALRKAERFGKNDRRLWDTMCELANLYTATGKLFRAANLYKEIIDSCRDANGSDSPCLVPYLYSLSTHYRAQGEIVKERDTINRIITLLSAASAKDYELAPYLERRLALNRELAATE